MSRPSTLRWCSLPPLSWRGWRALLLMSLAPLLNKVASVSMIIVSALWFEHSQKHQGTAVEEYLDYHTEIPALNPFAEEFSIVCTTMLASCAILLHVIVLAYLFYYANHREKLSYYCQTNEEIIYFKARFWYVQPEECTSAPVVKACAAIFTILLLTSVKDVETNLPPLEMTTSFHRCEYGHFSDCVTLTSVYQKEPCIFGAFTSSVCATSNTGTAVRVEIHSSPRSLETATTARQLVCTVSLLISSVSCKYYRVSDYLRKDSTDPVFDVRAGVRAVLLLLAGDVETNPGPQGKLTVKTARLMINPVRANWKNIGIELNIDMGTLNAIETRQNSDPDKCLPEMLDIWLKQVDPLPSWESLAEALESPPIGEGHLAQQILREKYCQPSERQTESCGVPQPSPVESDAEFTKKYSKHLKAKYSGQSVPVNDKWPPTPLKKYINLACINRQSITKDEANEFTKCTIRGNIDDIYYDKSQISMEQVAVMRKKPDIDEMTYPKVILVAGAPGVGKTTFAWELCRKWAHGELLQHFELVILLRLRDRSSREAKELIDLFPYPKKTFSESLVDEALERNGEGVLFLLEGFDELPVNLRTESSIYIDLIKGDLLPSASVLVTSRSYAVSDFQCKYSERMSQWVEILGFTRQQIDEYLIAYSGNDPKLLNQLRRYVSFNPPIHAAMYIPLNTVIVCEIYKDCSKGDCIIPSTMTELYTAFSMTLLIRYICDQEKCFRVRKMNRFEDLPLSIYDKFLALCKLASDGISNNQQLIFTDLPEDMDTLGFMQSVSELHISSGVSVSSNFLHLTIQEFLAAYHLSLQPSHVHIDLLKRPDSQQLYLRRKPSSSPDSSGTVAKFLAGITKLLSDHFCEQLPVPTSDLAVVDMKLPSMIGGRTQSSMHGVKLNTTTQPQPKIFGRDGRTKVEVQCHVSLTGNISHCVWLYESQNKEILQARFGCKTILVRITSDMTPMDCFAAGWCIGNLSSCKWKLCFIGKLSLDCIEMLHAGIIRANTYDDRKMCELLIAIIGDGVMNSDEETLKHIFHMLESEFEIMKVAYYYCRDEGGIDGGKNMYLTSCIEQSVCLKEVELVSAVHSHSWCWNRYDKENHFGSLPAVFKAMQLNNSVEKLKLVNVEFDIKAMLTHIKRTLTHLSIQNIEYLHEENGDLQQLLCFADSSLTSLDLTLSNVVNGEMVALLIRNKTALMTLSLKQCRLHKCNIAGVTEALKTNKILTKLDLSANYLDVNQTTLLFRVFTENQNTTLETLDVSDNEYSIRALEEMLISNICLHCLSITITPARFDVPSSFYFCTEYDHRITEYHHGIIDKQPTQTFFRDSSHYQEVVRSARHDPHSRAELCSIPGVLAYVAELETIDSVCQAIISALKKNATLQRLIIHTLFDGILVPTLTQCQDYDKVKNKIQIIQSSNPCFKMKTKSDD